MTPPVSQSLEVRDDARSDVWDAYVDGAPDGSVYHRSVWAEVIRDVFGHQTRQLSAWSSGRIVGVLPLVAFRSGLFGRFLVSMPFVNYGGIAADSPAAAAALLQAAAAYARVTGARSVELRHVARQCPQLPARTHKVSMHLRLQASADAQWTALDRKLRNQVRKAEKSDLTVQVGGAELLDRFYAVFSENMRDLGTPVQSRRFFARILAAFPSQAALLCVAHAGVPVAGAFVIWHKGTMEVPWASALRRWNHLCPNVLLYWEMLKFGIARGCRTFDFGRSTPDEGTYHFKKQWGAEPVPLYWEYWLREGAELPDRSPKNQRFSLAIAVWQRLPVAVTRLIGPRIVRSIP